MIEFFFSIIQPRPILVTSISEVHGAWIDSIEWVLGRYMQDQQATVLSMQSPIQCLKFVRAYE